MPEDHLFASETMERFEITVLLLFQYPDIRKPMSEGHKNLSSHSSIPLFE